MALEFLEKGWVWGLSPGGEGRGGGKEEGGCDRGKTSGVGVRGVGAEGHKEFVEDGLWVGADGGRRHGEGIEVPGVQADSV